ncbi:MAG: patatin-like phospholipase family protein [Acidimicrobiales bacterium]
MKPWIRRSSQWAFRDAVVFSGGGNAGAAQVGMVRALFEAGVRPDLFVGCSVGALNATFLALDPVIAQVAGLEEIWRDVSKCTVFSGTRRSIATHFIRRHNHLFEPDGLRSLIAGAVGVADLAETAVPVHVVTTDLGTGEPAWWSSGNPVDILTASACLPGVFPPVPIGSSLHVDGGVLCPVPVGRALSLGARRVWVLDVCRGRTPTLPARASALDVLLNSFALARRALRNEAPEDRRPGQEVVVIEADLPDLDPRDFSQTTRLMALGLDAGRRQMHASAALVPLVA